VLYQIQGSIFRVQLVVFEVSLLLLKFIIVL